ncbi:Eco57I restriction-modification methylase domain-containing protein [Clostridiales bacterium FE2010]|nr:Eco57I restriction-modification methylase domain-containing protein [Clostridiales bacterium FE2010]
MSAVIDKIEKILTNEYSIENYVALTSEIMDGMKLVAPDNTRKEYSNFSSHIENSTHVGNYTDPDGKKIIVLSVELKKGTYVENSRSTQRSYAKKLIENGNADAALVAFYTAGDDHWRLSFVRLDYEIKFENGRMKTAENMTPARRYSFLVGKDEPCHTAIERFRDYLENYTSTPTLDNLENAFSVEKVTKEFFELYCEKFLQLREWLENNKDFIEEAKLHNYTSEQFAKKTMGQIVFLYFLQKKGWLGVKAWPRSLSSAEYKKAFFSRGTKSRELIPKVYKQVSEDEYRIDAAAMNMLSNEDETFLSSCVKGEPWGTGPRNFMRRLFDLAEKKGVNFFDDYLEPLFYDALNVNRGDQGYDPALHCRIPFLSGGLFEPIDGYDWEHNRFEVPNELFSNKKDHKDRLADGILDIFDRYNFTMSEDEPLEREVAIDPEMLGKVFENLLDVKDRKSKGAFYTPREIVHYMCQESLINYLTNVMNVSEGAIRDFILYGDFMKDEDASVLLRAVNGGSYALLISEELYELNDDGTIKLDRMLELDKALQNVRVADPAVGSGAFPLGMLNEIVRARQNITTYMDITQKIKDPIGAKREIRYRRINTRSAHQLKYDTIRNCIFAVDIEPSAVDIAQLRLWLALVIDDEIDPNAVSALDGHRNPLPLPNLECNILCGNSLIDEFEGIKLINESDIIGTAGNEMQVNLYQSAFDATLQRLIDKQQELFKCDDTEKKYLIMQEIGELRDEVIRSQLSGATDEQLERYEATKSMASKPFVLWQLDFARVFRDKGGFDIIIGNPPYVGEKGNKVIFREIANSSLGRRFQRGKMDLFYYFFHLGIDIAKTGGIIGLITTNYYITATAGYNLRKDFHDRTDIVQLINFNECKIFESALGQHNMITLLQKGHSETQCKAVISHFSGFSKEKVSSILHGSDPQTDYIIMDQEKLYEGENFYIRLELSSGESKNQIFSKMQQGVKLGSICFINLGCHCVLSKITNKHIAQFGDIYSLNEGVYVLSETEATKFDYAAENERLRIKPFIKNSNIMRYGMTLSKMKFIYLRWEDEIDDFPTIKKHLLKFKPIRDSQIETYGEKTWPWYAIHRPREEFLFKAGEKIVLPYRSKQNIFGYTKDEVYASGDVFYILLNEKGKESTSIKYLLGLLNSQLYFYWLYHKGKRKGDILEMYYQPLSEIPIILPDAEKQKKIVGLVDKAISQAKNIQSLQEIQDAIDREVYQIYDISESEILEIEQLNHQAEKNNQEG